MSSPTPIITKPPKINRASLLPQGLMPIRDTIRHWTTWLWTALAAIPDLLFSAAMWAWHLLIASPEGLYAAASSAGMLSDAAMPEPVTAFIRVFALFGLIAKFISQRKPGA